MAVSEKINHVLEHGTIYCLKKIFGKKRKIGGRSTKEGFRIYGKIKEEKEIKEAFDELKLYLEKEDNKAILSKFCGSNIPISDAISFFFLTITYLVFLIRELSFLTICILLSLNIALFFILRYPLGMFLQRKLVMYFDFSQPRIVKIEKVKPDGILETNPVYFVKTDYTLDTEL